MMDQDDELTASVWDDVLLPGGHSTVFGQDHSNMGLGLTTQGFESLAILSPFADPLAGDDPEGDGDTNEENYDNDDDDNNSHQQEQSGDVNDDNDGYTLPALGAVDTNEYSIATVPATDGYSASTNYDYEREQITQLKNEERSMHKSHLLSELTHGSDTFEEAVTPKKMTNSLFNDRASPLPGVPIDFSNEGGVKDVTSPKRTAQLKNSSFKAKRGRKFSSKINSQFLSQSSQSKDEKKESSLGPLTFDATAQKKEKEDSVAEMLAKEVEAPLYEISSESKEKQKPPQTPDVQGDHNNGQSSATPTPEVEDKEINQLEISVGDPVKVGDITNAHIVYTVKAKNKNAESTHFPSPPEDSGNGGYFNVSRRYRDFRWLYHQLQANHPGRIIPPPPLKQTYIGRFNENFVENRRLSLEKMLTKISSLPHLANDSDFVMFLVSEDFLNELKERERVSGTSTAIGGSDGASVDSNGAELQGGELASAMFASGGVGGGFMSSIFSISSKFTEPDKYFLEKKVYIEDLEINLKQFYKSIDLISTQRLELIGIIDELAASIDELAGFEVLKVTTELLGDFSGVQLKLKDALDRTNVQDQLTLGFTIEEYLRIIESIKYTFDTRQRIYSQYESSQRELTSKQSQLEKTQRKYKTQQEKIDLLQFEVDKLQSTVKSQEGQFHQVSDTIKTEMSKFEIDKIEDFRNTIEIFIESSIEAQKEAIETWETFYESHQLAGV